MLDTDKNVLSTNFATQRIFCVKKREFQTGCFRKNCKIISKVLGKTRDFTLKSEKYKVQRGIKLEKSNIFADDAGVEHYPLSAIEFLI